MRALLQVVRNAAALWLAGSLVPGIHYTGGLVWLLLAGLVLGSLNLLVKPLLTFLSLPLIVLSLGLFYLVINGLVLYLAAWLMPHHLQVAGCGPAIIGGLGLPLFNLAVPAFAAARPRPGAGGQSARGALPARPGVGRKTANVVLGNGFGLNVGVVVDTHVQRLARRLGLTVETDPEKIERDLMEVVPRDDWTAWSNLLIFHGRQVCQARRPRCAGGGVAGLCPSAG